MAFTICDSDGLVFKSGKLINILFCRRQRTASCIFYGWFVDASTVIYNLKVYAFASSDGSRDEPLDWSTGSLSLIPRVKQQKMHKKPSLSSHFSERIASDIYIVKILVLISIRLKYQTENSGFFN